jgi:hypothetical protein
VPNTAPHRCRVKLVGRDCEHDLCYPIHRGVPDELRCVADQPAGYGRGGRGCCLVPPDMEDRVRWELRDNLQECRRLGYVLIRAA